jgi:oligopeptide/dipeptide ABC transporter ATP-binding protein
MDCVMRSIPARTDAVAAADARAATGEVLLQLEELSVEFATARGYVPAVRGLSLEVKAGECLGVVGESGAGKTQAFLAAVGLLPANATVRGSATFGATTLTGQPATQLDRFRGRHIGMVFQDPMTSLTPHLTVGAQIAEPIMRHTGVSRREARLRALALLRHVRITDPERRLRQFPHELSGGMRQRVMIAIALSCEPSLLIADEPTTALDVTVQAQILALLSDLKRERAMATVLITHDLGVVAGLADRIAVMQAGALVELGSAAAVLKTPRHPHTQELLRAAPRLDAEPAAPIAATGESPLSVAGLSVSFQVRRGLLGTRAELRALDDVSFRLQEGEALGVVGESGSGKSTLARAALRLIAPQAGRIVWMGSALEKPSARELRPLRRNLQMIFQDPLASLDPRMTVAQSVEEPLRVHRSELTPAERSAAAAEMLARVGLTPQLCARYPHELSGGQCQRVGIARAMVLRPRVLVCDEPLSALDMSVQQQITALLADLKREYRVSLLFVSHNLAVVKRLCERVLVLYLGRMMELAPAASLYERPLHPYTRELLAAVPVMDPDVQPGRLASSSQGEPPSPLAPPSGCVYRTRCLHAIEACRTVRPAWEDAQELRYVACHRWREL